MANHTNDTNMNDGKTIEERVKDGEIIIHDPAIHERVRNGDLTINPEGENSLTYPPESGGLPETATFSLGDGEEIEVGLSSDNPDE